MNRFLVASVVLAAISLAGAIEYAHYAQEEIAHYPIEESYGHEEIHEHIPKPYAFKYGVHDPHTGDMKSQHETRHGDVVVGEYTVKEPDGTMRIVKYTADKHNGFQAKVYKTGHAVHPAIYGHHHEGLESFGQSYGQGYAGEHGHAFSYAQHNQHE